MADSIRASEPEVTEPLSALTLPPDQEASLRFWWHVIRPERLRIAAEVSLMARDYERLNLDQAADALRHVVYWLRAAAGEVGADVDDEAADKCSRLAALFVASADTESGREQ